MKRWLTIALHLSSALPLFAASPYDGLCGEELFYAVQAQVARVKQVDTREVWSAIATVDHTSDGVLNIFSPKKIPFPQNGVNPEGAGLFQVLPQSYWGGSVPGVNLVNIFAAPLAEVEQRMDYPPMFNSEKIEFTYNNNMWGSGTYAIAPGYSINCYYPPKGFEGDFARIVMMMAVAYPCSGWRGAGQNIFSGINFPLFQPYYISELLAMNGADSVDERETKRNRNITAVQGVGNPFVEYPQLAEYIWGKENGKPFHSGENDSRTPIKAIYTVADNQFCCYSPYLPGAVEWFTFNGVRYNGEERVALDGLNNGKYLVRYGGQGFSGSVIIEIDR